MVFWGGDVRADRVKNARTEKIQCFACNNTSDHVLYRAKTGVGFGNPLTGKLWLSTRSEWMLVCSICESFIEASKDMVEELQKPASTKRIIADKPHDKNQCSSCKNPVSQSANFCGNCGKKVTESQP